MAFPLGPPLVGYNNNIKTLMLVYIFSLSVGKSFLIAVFSSPSASGSEERGAEAALPPSSSSDTNTVARGKLGNSQSLRVRMDSYPAGKQYLKILY